MRDDTDIPTHRTILYVSSSVEQRGHPPSSVQHSDPYGMRTASDRKLDATKVTMEAQKSLRFALGAEIRVMAGTMLDGDVGPGKPVKRG